MRSSILSVVSVFLMTTSSQTQGAIRNSLYLTAAERQTIVQTYPNQRSTKVKSMDAGKHVIELYVDQLTSGPQSGSPMLHTGMTEIYYVLEGSATFVTGGKRVGPDPASTTPGTVVGGLVEGGAEHVLRAGDVVVTPPGTFHAWKAVDSPRFSYIAIHVDPEKVVPADYLDPALKWGR